MTLQEAMKACKGTDRRFKAAGIDLWLYVDDGGLVRFYQTDDTVVLSEKTIDYDYELEPLPEKSVTITEARLRDAVEKSYIYFLGQLELDPDRLIKELGL